MKQLTINLGTRSYPIYIGDGLLTQKNILRQHINGQQVMIVTNETVAPLYLDAIKAAVSDLQCDCVILPDGEQYKTLASFETIIDQLLEHKHHRSTTLVALGGGVVGDITGFASACYQRGTAFIQIPTSLLAQVDASVGGKTAVNHPKGKNMIGAFHQPRCVIIDTATLTTLPKRQLSAGLAETIKAALISDSDFFDWLEQHMDSLVAGKSDILAHAIDRACAIKCDIVAQDETEITGTRALLNLGHTFGHAIEQNLGYVKWLHGEAVAVGMILAADMSEQLGWLSKDDFQRIKQLILQAKLPIHLPPGLECASLLQAMLLDKKNRYDKIRLVLLRGIGEAVLTDGTDHNQLQQTLEKYL